MTKILMPQLSLAMEEGTIISKLVPDGATVEMGQPILEIETDKAIAEVEATAGGVIRFLAEEGAVVSVNSPLAEIVQDGASFSDAEPLPESTSESAGASKSADTGEESILGSTTGRASPRRRRAAPAASPAARRRARELKIDLDACSGTGPGGRIVLEDIEKSLVEKTQTAGSFRDQVQAQLIASWREIPHIHISGQLDGEGLARAKSAAPTGVTLTDILLCVIAQALEEVPELNAILGAMSGKIHIAVAVAAPDGVISPVIRNVNQLSLEQISKERARVVEAAREGRTDRRDLAGATFTLTNLGAYPVDFFTPIISGPQVAALATGRLVKVPIVKNGKTELAHRIWMNAAIDHRAADGIAGAKFLAVLEKSIDAL